VKTHTSIGARLLSGSRAPLLRLAEMIAWAHHERWDGTGYAGMSGQGIPSLDESPPSRDVFALTHDCPYKSARSVEEALSEIGSQRGQFDPQVVDAFLKVHEEASALALERCVARDPSGATSPRLGRLCMARERESRGWTAVIARTRRLPTRVLSRRCLRAYLSRGTARE
jgi:HD-GYP domain-containing protein (c-di-GMP phosphodiesterase class II)